jgi:hypothetical protein
MQDDKETMQEELENNMLTALYLLVILTKIAKQSVTEPTEAMQVCYLLRL